MLLLFSSLVVSSSLQLQELQHAKLPCPSPFSWSLFKLRSIESVMPSNHLILCHPLLLLPSIFPSIRVFSNESAVRIRWPKDWSFSFSIIPSSEYSGFISFRMDWFDLAVREILKSQNKGLIIRIPPPTSQNTLRKERPRRGGLEGQKRGPRQGL